MSALPPINQVILTGELTEEPSVHYLAPDFPEVRLRLKTEEEVTGREGGRPYRQRLFHRVIARGQVGMAVEHLHEGSYLSIAGRIEYAREADREGRVTTSTEIIALRVRIHQQTTAPSSTASPSAPPPFDAHRYKPTEGEDPLS